MRVLYLFNRGLMTPDFALALRRAGHTVDIIADYECSYKVADEACQTVIEKKLMQAQYDFVASYNYIPSASCVCQKHGVIYAAWMYDAYQTTLYCESLYYPCNRIFVFDSKEYEYLNSLSVPHVNYLPLAVDTQRIGALELTQEEETAYSCDVSFVGRLYCDPSVNGYNLIKSRLRPEQAAQLEEIFDSLAGRWDMGDTLQDRLCSMDYQDFPKLDSMDVRERCSLPDDKYYMVTALSKALTQRDRSLVLNAAAKRHDVYMYTFEPPVGLCDGVKVRPGVDYMTQMPKVFYCSKINLNITLRSIECGIPLRNMDVMGSGGFLLTNRQKDMQDYFEDGKDYVSFENIRDMEDKMDWFLRHEASRMEIAMNGYRKVSAYHNYERCVARIAEAVREA